MINIDTGDSVFHRPTREWWQVAGVDGDRLYWVGWPPGRANLADCLLVDKADASERAELLARLAQMNGDDPRKSLAERTIARESKWSRKG